MLEHFSEIRRNFWSESFWLPPNTTWDSLEANNYRHFNDIYYSIITALVLFVVRLTLERLVYQPIGIYLGLKPTEDRRQTNNNKTEDSILEKAFRDSNGKIDSKQIRGLAKQMDWSERQIARWLRKKRALTKPSLLSKFTENAWKFSYYVFSFSCGIYIYWDQMCLLDTSYCFTNYPHQTISTGEWAYHNLQTGFILMSVFTLFIDSKKTDFWMMFVHHLITLFTLYTAWATIIVKVVLLCCLIHDMAGVPMAAAKMAFYVKKQRLADILFVVFAITWIATRLGVYSYRIVYYMLFEFGSVVPVNGAYYAYNAVICCLQLMHVLWTRMIFKIVMGAVINHKVKDVRSDEEGSSELSDNQ